METPKVTEIPRKREPMGHDPFIDEFEVVDETGYPPNVSRFAKRLAEIPVAEVVSLDEYRKRHGA